MKLLYTRCICAVLGALSMFVSALYAVAEPVLTFVACGCEALSCGLEKLDRDLAHARSLHDSGVGEGISSDLKRESHGYRQSSAPSRPDRTMPAMA